MSVYTHNTVKLRLGELRKCTRRIHKSITKSFLNYKLKITIMEETFTWVYNIIESCNNDFHFECADALISLYSNKYMDTDRVLGLRLLRQNKWNTVHSILI
jgi:hypothetical protein